MRGAQQDDASQDDARPSGPRPWSPAERGWAVGLLLLLTVLLALWGAFLVPFRVGATVVPVSLVIAAVGNVLLGRAAARLVGSTGALLTGALWIGIALVLASRRAEGDVVVQGGPVGLGFLLAGALGSAVAYGAAVLRPAPGTARR